jgi:glucose/arabinose dehydrogenase
MAPPLAAATARMQRRLARSPAARMPATSSARPSPARLAVLFALLGASGAFAAWWFAGGGVARLDAAAAGEPARALAPAGLVRIEAEGARAVLEPWMEFPGMITNLVVPDNVSGLTFVTGKAGEIWVVEAGATEPILWADLTDRVGRSDGERGLLGLAFPPGYPAPPHAYVNYTNGDGDTVIERLRIEHPDGTDPGQIVVSQVLVVEQPWANHNGGQLAFGGDGMLYVGMGDGGSGGDPRDYAENPQSLLGKLLRLDVDGPVAEGSGYAIPLDNPLIGSEALPEIFAIGLRNPWRFSFDHRRDWIWIADVGQNRWEEINGLPVSDARGAHFGWNTLEGRECFSPREGCPASYKVEPLHVYDHDHGCSVTGGHVLSGAAWGDLDGAYVFADFCTGRIEALRGRADGSWEAVELLASGLPIASFGQDAEGRSYVLAIDGRAWRLEPASGGQAG